MIFPKLNFEAILQVSDKTRLFAGKSYVTKDEVALTIVEIEPDAGLGFISVFATKYRDWFLDYEYATDGAKVVTVRVDNGSGPVTSSFTLNVITELDDKLFSNDNDIKSIKTEVMKWVPDGKTSFKYLHRKVQTLIVEYINEIGKADSTGNKLTKDAFINIDEVRQWSAYYVLELLYLDLSNSVDDVFMDQSKIFFSEKMRHRKRAFLRLDVDGDGIIDKHEGITLMTMDLVRR